MQQRRTRPSGTALAFLGSATISLAACLYLYYTNRSSNNTHHHESEESGQQPDTEQQLKDNLEISDIADLRPKHDKSTLISLVISPSVLTSLLLDAGEIDPNYTALFSTYQQLYPNLTLIIHPNVTLPIESPRVLKVSNLNSIPFLLNQLNASINLINLQDISIASSSSPSLNRLHNVIALNDDIRFIDVL